MSGINKAVANLKFIKGADSWRGLAGYLQSYFGQTAGVIRACGTATVLAANTTVVVPDTGIAAGDILSIDVMTQGANANTQPVSFVITPGVGFTVTVSQAPGTGGLVLNYIVVRPVP